MEYLGEKKSEELLESFGFNVVARKYCSDKNKLIKSIGEVGLPVVMKVSGKKIVHKHKINGVVLGINTYTTVLEEFSRLKKIKGSDGVMIQKQIDFDREYLIGVKKTEDFGHVIIFGAGGTNVEEKKDVAFRVVPLEKEDAYDMIKEVRVTKGILAKEKLEIIKTILRMSEFVSRYNLISEMDINPFVVSEGMAVVLDARILFE